MSRSVVWSQIVSGVFAAGLTWTTTLLVEGWARRRRLFDIPNARSSHRRPTPRLGGIGIVAGVIAGLALGAALDPAVLAGGRVTAVVGLGAIVAALGLFDDLRPLPASLRLVVQALIATATVVSLDTVARAIDDHTSGGLALAIGLVAGIWIVAFINAFNFMDGIDGIAGGQALVGGVGVAAVGWQLGDLPVVAVGVAVGGAALAFLTVNWSPARIFMGDAGSAFLGFVLASVPLVAEAPVRVFVPVLLLMWPFLFDTAFTLVRRATRGEHLFEAHRSHLYQRLVATGLTHTVVAAAYIGLAAVGIAAARAMAEGTWTAATFWLVLITGLAAGLWRWTVARELAAAAVRPQ